MKPDRLLVSMTAATGAGLFPILADSAFKGTLLLLGVGLLVVLMARASAATRHLAWTVGLAGLIALPLLSVSLPQWRVLPTWMAIGRGEPLPRPQPPAPAQPEAGAAFTPARVSPSAAPAMEMPPAPARLLTGTEMTDATPAPGSPPDGPQTGSPDEAAAAGMHPCDMALTIWLGGVLLLSARLAVARYRLRTFQRRTPEVTTGPLHQTLEDLRRELAVRRPVRLHVCQSPDAMPVTWGVLDSRIALPSTATTWGPEQLRAVLMHELAHVRRWDCLTQLLAEGTRALYWFHPLVWVAAWRLRIERERACDDHVLRSGLGAPDYAEHLLHVVSGCRAPRARHRACSVAMADRSGFESRVEALLDDRTDRRALTGTALSVAVLGAAVILMPVAMLRATSQELIVSHHEDIEAGPEAEDSDQDPDATLMAEAEKLIRPLSDNFFDRELRAAAMLGLMDMLHPDRRDEAAAAARALEASGLIKAQSSQRHFPALRKALVAGDRARIIEHTRGIKEAIQTVFWTSLRYVPTFLRGKPAPADRAERLASGTPDAHGLVQSIYLRPHRKEYQPGEVVELRSLIRNTGKETILLATSFSSTEARLTSDEGTELRLDSVEFLPPGIHASFRVLLLPGEEYESGRNFRLGIDAGGIVAQGAMYPIATYPGETFEIEASTRNTFKLYDRTARKFVAAHRADPHRGDLVSGKLTLAVARNPRGNKRDVHWADAVDGIAVGIHLEKRRWRYGFAPPLATAHVKLSTNLDKRIIEGPAAFTLELDGKSYRYRDQSGTLAAAADLSTPIPINDDWVGAEDGKPLELLLGVRRIRVHFLGTASPSVSFQVPGHSRQEWQDPWGEPSGGVKIGLRTLEPSWVVGEPPRVEVRLRNDNPKIAKNDHAALEDAHRRWWTKATPAAFELELDGVRYQAVEESAGWGRGLWPGGRERDVYLQLDPAIWKDLRTIPIGRHRLRIIYTELDLDPPPASNAVEFEVRPR